MRSRGGKALVRFPGDREIENLRAGIHYGGYTLDPFQERAIAALDRGDSVIVAAPTGAGKTLIAEYGIDLAMQRGRQIVYTAPVKALSNQKVRALPPREAVRVTAASLDTIFARAGVC